MPRRPREEAAGAFHHVIAKGNAGGVVAYDDLDRRDFLVRLERAAVHCRWSCFAYCMLDTHVHLIVRTPQPNLGRGMQRLLSQYAQKLNRRYLREGHLFRGRFYSKRIQSTEHLLSAILYVLMNPVRAGIVRRPADWMWSSCAATIGHAAAPAFLDVEGTLDLLNADPGKARSQLSGALEEAADAERMASGS